MAEILANQGNPIHVKYIVTAAIYWTNILFGSVFYLIGPSRFDVADNVHSDLLGVSYGPMVRAAGTGFGALLSSLILSRISRQTGHIATAGVAGLSVLAVPFARQLWQYIASEFVYGIANGVNGSNKNAWILEMWETKANPYLQGMHFMYSIGSVIAPLLVEPFLSNESTTPSERQSRILIPFSIVCGLIIITALSYIFLYKRVPYIDSKRTIQKITAKKTDKGNDEQPPEYYNAVLIILSGILMCSYTGIELSTLGFSATFVYCLPLGFSKADAAFVSCVLSASFAAGRFASIFIALRLKTRTMLCGSFVFMITGNVLMFVFATNSRLMVWLAFVVIGLGNSCVNPCVFSFVEERINVTTGISSIFVLSACLSSLGLPVLLGRFMEEYPLVYVYVNFAGLGICIFVLVLILLLDQCVSRRKRYEQIN